MDGVHELAGVDSNFGPIPIDPNEPLFFDEWERRVFGVTLAVAYAGLLNFDEFRFGIERMPAWQYFAARYYEKWAATLETNMVEKGVITLEEIEARVNELKKEG
jgi:hypothetical protein